MKDFFVYLIIGLVYLLSQIFFFDFIKIDNWAHPHIAPLWILLLPVTINRYFLYSVSFLFGLALDLTLLPLGLQSLCLMLVSTLRYPWMQFISPQVASLKVEGSNFQAQSFSWRLLYISPLLGVYAFAYQALYQFSWIRLSSILIQTVGDWLFSTVISVLILLFFYNSDANKKS